MNGKLVHEMSSPTVRGVRIAGPNDADSERVSGRIAGQLSASLLQSHGASIQHLIVIKWKHFIASHVVNVFCSFSQHIDEIE